MAYNNFCASTWWKVGNINEKAHLQAQATESQKVNYFFFPPVQTTQFVNSTPESWRCISDGLCSDQPGLPKNQGQWIPARNQKESTQIHILTYVSRAPQLSSHRKSRNYKYGENILLDVNVYKSKSWMQHYWAYLHIHYCALKLVPPLNY